MKTSLKNRLHILSLFFVIIPRGPAIAYKKGFWVGAEEKGPSPSSGVNIQGLQRNAQKSVMHV